MPSPIKKAPSILRILLASLAGALTGGVLTAIAFFVFNWIKNGYEDALGNAKFFLLTALISSVFFAAGILVFGLPVWWYMHRQNLKKWQHFSVVGFLLPFLTAAIFLFSNMDFFLDARFFLETSLVLGLIGIAVSLVIRHIAYRPTRV